MHRTFPDPADAAMPAPTASCDAACPLRGSLQSSLHGSRRSFLGQLGATMAGAWLTLGLGRTAQALTLSNVPLIPLASSGKTKTYPIPAADGVQIDRDDDVILVRWLGSVYAFSLNCPHQKTALRWIERDEYFQCPKHRSEYAADGYFMTGRATRGMDRFAITRKDNTVIVDLDTLIKQDDDEKKWEAAAVSLGLPTPAGAHPAAKSTK